MGSRIPAGLWAAQHLTPPAHMLAGDTLTAQFWDGVAKRQNAVWLRQKELGIWQSWTWARTGEIVREVGHGLISLGLERGACASILANTKVEWVWCDLAILSCAAVANGIYPTDSAEQVA